MPDTRNAEGAATPQDLPPSGPPPDPAPDASTPSPAPNPAPDAARPTPPDAGAVRPPPAIPRFPAAGPPRPAVSLAARARRSLLFKTFAIGALVVLLLVPLLMLDGLIGERERLRDEARREVAAQWGLDQSLGGPVLSVPYTATETARDASGNAVAGTVTVTRYAHLFPDELTVRGRLVPQVRTRGIFKVVLYETALSVSGRFPALDAGALGVPAAALRPAEAVLQVGITDMTGIREAVRINWGGTVREADPGLPTDDIFSSGVAVPVALPDTGGTPFRFGLRLNGSGSLGVLPVGKTTRLQLTSPWATPSFAGAFLPERRTVADSGFTAEWRVLHLNRNFPQQFTGPFNRPTALAPDAGGIYDSGTMGSMAPMAYPADGGLVSDGANSAFGVTLLLPVDEYQKTNRAAEYGLLLVILTFTTFFFVEVLSGRRFHPVQYLLVGLAVTLFYLLLLAFAEYVPFDAAYGVAAVAILALVTLYARAVFGEWRLAGVVGGLLAIFYGYFYVLLQLEAYALLAGSLGLLVALAAVMYLSRKVDWYGDSGDADAAATPPARPALGAPAVQPAA